MEVSKRISIKRGDKKPVQLSQSWDPNTILFKDTLKDIIVKIKTSINSRQFIIKNSVCKQKRNQSQITFLLLNSCSYSYKQ